MIVRKQYIPKRYRNKKLVNTSASGGFIAGSSNSTFIPEHKELRGIVTITDILNEGATDIHLTKTVAESLLTTITNFNNWFEWDGTGTAIKAKYALYSVGSVSAYGIGSAGGAGGTGSTVIWGTEAGGGIPLTVESVTKTLSLASHTHSGYLTSETDPTVPDHVKAITALNISTWNAKEPAIVKGTTAQYFRGDMSLAAFPTSLPASDVSAWAKASTKPTYNASEIGGLGDNYRWLTNAYIATWDAKEPAITKLTAFNKNFGTTAGTVAEGNDSRINNGQTAFGWGNHASAGYALNSALTAHINNVDNPHSVTKTQVGLSNVENTSDTNKPVSTATQTALNLKANLESPIFTGSVTAPTFIGSLSGNASSATKLGTATVGSTQLPFYLNAGTATAITQANLRIGLFGATAIGSATAPVYIAANGVPKASTSFGGVTGIGTASPLMDGTVAVGTSTLAARQDHRHPVDTSRAAVGQTMYIGTTAVAINRASATLNLTGIGTLTMGGVLSGATTGVFSSTVQATTAILTNLTANYLPKHTATGLVNSSIFDNGTNVGICTTTPTATLDVNGIGKFKDDILMTFNTWSYNNWTYPTDKNSLNKFLKLFDIDTAGNLVVKTNLYSTGEVTAYSTGAGVSGLTLQGDMNANGKNITGANRFYSGIDLFVGLDVEDSGLYKVGTSYNKSIAAYSASDMFIFADSVITVNPETSLTEMTGAVKATEFKFGRYKFMEDTDGDLGIYNGTTKIATILKTRTNSNL